MLRNNLSVCLLARLVALKLMPEGIKVRQTVFFDTKMFCRGAELQAARDQLESLQAELAEVQRAADESEGRIMELCEGTESLNQELIAAKAHIARQAEEKEQVLRSLALHAKQMAELSSSLEDSEAQKNQANESLALMGAKMDELEEKLVAQEKKLLKTTAM